MIKIAIQGGVASFHDEASRHYFDQVISIVACDDFPAVFAAVGSSAEAGVVAIENSLYGSINQVYDLLLGSHVKITGEVYLRVNQCLLTLPGAKLSAITDVHSHPVALAQCAQFLDCKLPHAQRHEQHDTALSARDIAKQNDPTQAAIASELAAKKYGLDVAAKNIETNHENYTRFVVIEPNVKVQPTKQKRQKVSLVLQTQQDTKPGALHAALGVFAERNINLTLLHSRPLIGKAWHYMFYVDILLENQRLPEITTALDKLGYKATILGGYAPGKVY